ncbi:hypothetical protein AGOR_G00195860 [Albula goreensis]|uniref:Secreted protein n=1 Tax=Albula goreensis TaxID=1534307 RepID=A0A8T3CVE7_9TELE|nr:hypothetical protein AGOR_G00195860 [Albula goreensis]
MWWPQIHSLLRALSAAASAASAALMRSSTVTPSSFPFLESLVRSVGLEDYALLPRFTEETKLCSLLESCCP